MSRFTCISIVLVLVVLVDCRGGRGGGGRGSSGSSGKSSGYSSGSSKSSGSTKTHSSYSSSYNSRSSPQVSPTHSFDYNSWKKSLPNLGTISKPSQFKPVVSHERGLGSSIIPVSTGARTRTTNTERPRTSSTVARPSGSTNRTTSTSGPANTYGRTVYNSTGQYRQSPRPLSAQNTTALHAPPLQSISNGFHNPSAPPMDLFANKPGSNGDLYKPSAPPLDNPGFNTNPRPLGFANTGTNQPIGWNFDNQKQFGQSSNQGFGIANAGVNTVPLPGTHYQGASPGFHATQGFGIAHSGVNTVAHPGTQNQGASPGFHATQGFGIAHSGVDTLAHPGTFYQGAPPGNSASNNYGTNYNRKTTATNYQGLNYPSATNYQGVNSHTPTNYQGGNNNYPTNQGFNTNYQGANFHNSANPGFNPHNPTNYGVNPNYPSHNQGYYQQNMYQPGMSGYYNMPAQNYYQPTNLPPPPPGYSPVMFPTYQKSSSNYGTKIILGLALWQLMKGNQHHHHYQNSYQPGYQTGYSSPDSMDYRPKHTTYYSSSGSNSRESGNVVETTHYITPDLNGNSTVLKGNMTCTSTYNMDSMGKWSNFTLNDFQKQYPNSTFPLFASPNATEKFEIIQGQIIHNETVSITCCGTQSGPIDIQLLSSGKNNNVNCVHFVKKVPFRKLIFHKIHNNETWVPIQLANGTHFGTPLAPFLNTTTHFGTPLAPFPNITTHFGTPLAPMPTLGSTGNGTQFGIGNTTDYLVDLTQTFDALGVNLNQTFSSLNTSGEKNVGAQTVDVQQTFLALGANSTTIKPILGTF